MEKKVIKLGVVGLKRGASVAGLVIGDDNVVIRAIADTNPERLEKCKREFEEKGVKDMLCFYRILYQKEQDRQAIQQDRHIFLRRKRWTEHRCPLL